MMRKNFQLSDTFIGFKRIFKRGHISRRRPCIRFTRGDGSGFEKLQSLEPAGIGARSLQECILLQLRRLPERNEQAEWIAEAYFELFARKNWKALTLKTGIPLKDIQGIADMISALDPRPGLRYAHEEPGFT